MVGEMSFLESRPPSVSVIVTKPSTVFQISRDKINSRLLKNAEFKANFYHALALFLSNRLRETTDQFRFGNIEEDDLLETAVWDGVAQAGSRFVQIIHLEQEFAELCKTSPTASGRSLPQCGPSLRSQKLASELRQARISDL